MVDFRYKGQRITRTLPFARTQKEADDAEAIIKADIFRQELGLVSPDTDFREFVADVFLPYSELHKKSFESDVYACRVLVRYFKGKGLRQLTPQLIDDFKLAFAKTPTKNGGKRQPSSVNNYVRILSKILSIAVERDLLESNPCRKVKLLPVNNARTRILADAEEQALLTELDGQMRDIVIFALNTGMRRGEIYNLKWDDVDFSRRVITIQESKSGKKRIVPMNDRVMNLLRELPREDLVFPSPVTGGVRVGVKRAFASAMKRAGIANFRFHDLRHTAATRMADRGAGIHTLQKILGHADIKTTSRYTHAADVALQAAVDTLG